MITASKEGEEIKIENHVDDGTRAYIRIPVSSCT